MHCYPKYIHSLKFKHTFSDGRVVIILKANFVHDAINPYMIVPYYFAIPHCTDTLNVSIVFFSQLSLASNFQITILHDI